GIVCGALVGFGFAIPENAAYLLIAAVEAGFIGLWHALWVRAVLGAFTHAVFTATVGGGIGWGRARRAGVGGRAAAVPAPPAAPLRLRRRARPAASLAAAFPPPSPPGAPAGAGGGRGAGSLSTYVPVVPAAGLAPGVLALAALAEASRRRRA